MKNIVQVSLLPEEMPTAWYNIQPDLAEHLEPLPPPKGDKEVMENLPNVMIHKCLEQEGNSQERWIEMSEGIQVLYHLALRPRPLVRLIGLEKKLQTPAEIWVKTEYTSPTGSHKVNTAIVQAFYAKEQGVKCLVTETGAGQWGTALSYAAAMVGLKCRVYWVRAVYKWKKDRRDLMKMYGSEVYASPSERTEFGRELLKENPDHPGSLAIAITEGMTDAKKNKDTVYCLGSVLNHVLLHQTIIGLETKKQFERIGKYPTIMIGCLGGGSNFGGFTLPFLGEVIRGERKIKFIAAQTQSTPNLQGEYRYNFADHAEITPMLKMYTLGHDIESSPICADGLRYHGCAPILSLLRHHGLIDTVAYPIDEKYALSAAPIILQTGERIWAPESTYAGRCAIDEAIRCREENRKEIIAVNASGHGFMDMPGYDKVLKLSER